MKLITKLMHKFNVLTVKIIMKSVVQFCSVTALFESIAYLEKHNTSYQKNIVIRFLKFEDKIMSSILKCLPACGDPQRY